jgi:hypothetical protein
LHAFTRAIGIDYSGAETPTASLKPLRSDDLRVPTAQRVPHVAHNLGTLGRNHLGQDSAPMRAL